jgi:hypothetical protein
VACPAAVIWQPDHPPVFVLRLPVFAMYAMPLPPAVITAIDALCRAFLWNALEKATGAKCVVAWDKAWHAKEEGRLGIRSLQLQNDCLQIKQLHRMHARPDLPWANWVWRSLRGPVCSPRQAALVGPHWVHLCSLMTLY